MLGFRSLFAFWFGGGGMIHAVTLSFSDSNIGVEVPSAPILLSFSDTNTGIENLVEHTRVDFNDNNTGVESVCICGSRHLILSDANIGVEPVRLILGNWDTPWNSPPISLGPNPGYLPQLTNYDVIDSELNKGVESLRILKNGILVRETSCCS